MTPNEITFTKRYKMPEQYEHEEVSVSAQLDGETVEEGLTLLAAHVDDFISSRKGGNSATESGDTHGQESSEEVSKKSNKKASSESKKSASKKSNGSEEGSGSGTLTPPQTETKTEPKPETFTKYNRELPAHVDVLTSFLTKIAGGETWKTNPMITQFSMSLVGQDFTGNTSGQIHPEFQDKCKKFLGIGAGGL